MSRGNGPKSKGNGRVVGAQGIMGKRPDHLKHLILNKADESSLGILLSGRDVFWQEVVMPQLEGEATNRTLANPAYGVRRYASWANHLRF